jgi:hypothetical protein
VFVSFAYNADGFLNQIAVAAPAPIITAARAGRLMSGHRVEVLHDAADEQ